MATRKAYPGLRNVSYKRQISTPYWLRKCFNPSVLPRTPSTFQLVSRKALHRSVLLGRAAIFSYKKNGGLQDSARARCPCGEGRDGRGKPASPLHSCLEGKVIEEI